MSHSITSKYLCKRLPDEDDVYQGVMAAKIAAHIGDIEKKIKGAYNRDREISQCRQNLDWEGIIANAQDSELVRKRLRVTEDKTGCSMCGKLCAVSCRDRY